MKWEFFLVDEVLFWCVSGFQEVSIMLSVLSYNGIFPELCPTDSDKDIEGGTEVDARVYLFHSSPSFGGPSVDQMGLDTCAASVMDL